jgi:hypothetical protein
MLPLNIPFSLTPKPPIINGFSESDSKVLALNIGVPSFVTSILDAVIPKPDI